MSEEVATAQSPQKETEVATETAAATPAESPSKSAVDKKESFQWSTPADEFADDVGSDIEEDDSGYTVQGTTGEGGVVILKADSVPARRPRVKSKQTFPCPKCDKVWHWPWELRRHLMMHFKEKERLDASAYKCKECGKGFQWKRDLAQHMRLHTGEKLLVCSVCGKKFVTRQALLHHVVVHTGEKPFQCSICGNRFTQPANLRTHTKKKHDQGPIKGCKCPHCHETFPSIVSIHQHILEDHQNVVAEQREELALEKLKREQDKLEKERRKLDSKKRREEKRREKYDLHDFRDPNKPEWQINYEFHLGEGMVRGVDWDRTPSNGELACDECEQKFGWRYEIMFHRLCHMTDDEGLAKNKVCPECDTVFKVPIGLKHHLLLHTGELPFLCLHCWRSFSSHIDLKLHIRREHLFHLDLPTPKQTKKRFLKDDEDTPKRKVVKKEEPTQMAMINGQQVQLANMINEHGEQIQVVVQPSGSEESQIVQIGDSQHQAIVVGPDGTIVNTNNQDMIVVIQSDEYEQNQGGLMVVDPSQLQQIVGSNGVPMTITQDGQATMIVSEGGEQGQENSSATEMIVSDQGSQGAEGSQYISLAMTEDGQQQQQVVLSTNAEGQQTASINGTNYVVVQADEDADGKQTLMVQQGQEVKGSQGIIVQEMMDSPEDGEEQQENQVVGIVQESKDAVSQAIAATEQNEVGENATTQEEAS